MSESEEMRRAMIACSKAGARVFRNNSGVGWAGKVQKITSIQRVAVGPGDVIVRQARPLHAGLCPGSSDLIGIVPVVIAPEHVGKTIGVFAAIENKSDTGTATEEQNRFIAQIQLLGGLAGIARCTDDALAIISGLSKQSRRGDSS